MAKEPSPRKTTENEPASGLGLEKFSMSAVGASETQEASEISRRWFRTVVAIVLFALIVVAGIWWFTVGQDFFFKPSPADEQYLVSLQDLGAARAGTISDFKFVGVNTVSFKISPQLSLTDKDDQFTLRQAVVELVASLGDYRPGRAVRVLGYGSEQAPAAEGRRLLKGDWGDKSLLEAFRAHAKELPIWVKIAGEKQGLEGGQGFE
jgi:hypothetical protein